MVDESNPVISRFTSKIKELINNKADKTNATQSDAGLMSAEDKIELDNIKIQIVTSNTELNKNGVYLIRNLIYFEDNTIYQTSTTLSLYDTIQNFTLNFDMPDPYVMYMASGHWGVGFGNKNQILFFGKLSNGVGLLESIDGGQTFSLLERFVDSSDDLRAIGVIMQELKRDSSINISYRGGVFSVDIGTYNLTYDYGLINVDTLYINAQNKIPMTNFQLTEVVE